MSGIPASWSEGEKFKNLIDYLTSPHLDPSKFTIRNSDALFLIWHSINRPELGDYALDKIVDVKPELVD